MSYATPAELRDEYSTGGADEFAALSDAELQRALDRASGLIDRYRPGVALNAGALALLRSACLPVARRYAHDELTLDAAHPVSIDYDEALAWLSQLSAGRVVLPVDPVAGSGSNTAGPVVVAASRVFV